MSMPPIPGYTALALLYRDSYYMPDGLLVRSSSGILAHFQGGAIRSIDQRKAQASLEHMEAIRRRRDEALAAGSTPEPYFDAEKEHAEDEADES